LPSASSDTAVDDCPEGSLGLYLVHLHYTTNNDYKSRGFEADVFKGRMSFLSPNQQHQSTECNRW